MSTTKRNRINNPPLLSEAKSYDDWIKLVDIWQKVTDVEKAKQGPVLLLSLEGEAQEAALQIPTDDLLKDDGVLTLIKRLDDLFKKDDVVKKYQVLEHFDTYRRSSTTDINKYIIEFEKRLNKTKAHGTKWDNADDVLAYRLLKNANLTESKEQLAKATIGELTYKNIKDKLKSVFGETQNPPPTSDQIKTEQINFAGMPNWREDQHHEPAPEDYYDTYFNYRNNNFRPHQFTGSNNRSAQANSSNIPPRRNTFYRGAPSMRPNRGSPSYTPRGNQRGRNPLDRSGQTSRCSNCQSINHWVQQCPDAHNPTLFQETEDITLFEGDLDDANQLKSLVAETLCAAVIDCGASRTCCGQSWWQGFTDTLSQEELDAITLSPSNKTFKFGAGGNHQSLSSAEFPANINGKAVTIKTDIVKADIPLLLSKESLKNAEMKIDFMNDTAEFLGMTIDLINTRTGHYAIPITAASSVFNSAIRHNAYNDSNLINMANTILTSSRIEKMSHREMANKLHKQFAHPPMERLLKLVNSAGQPWCTDLLKDEIRKISQDCHTCRIYKKAPPRPVTGLPLATHFQECVAMDLKFYKKHIILHIIDHATRLSASTLIRSKEPEVVIQGILQNWISVYGTAEKFLTDNGGEFCNA